jgi:hypothetical protein
VAAGEDEDAVSWAIEGAAHEKTARNSNDDDERTMMTSGARGR